MAANVDSILTIAPELKCETPAVINFFIAMAQRRISSLVWGIYNDDGVNYLAAHLITMKNRKGTPGNPSMEKVGDVQAEYVGFTNSRTALTSTSYGVEYLELRKLVVVTATIV